MKTKEEASYVHVDQGCADSTWVSNPALCTKLRKFFTFLQDREKEKKLKKKKKETKQRSYVAFKSYNIYYLALQRRGLLTPNTEGKWGGWRRDFSFNLHTWHWGPQFGFSILKPTAEKEIVIPEGNGVVNILDCLGTNSDMEIGR